MSQFHLSFATFFSCQKFSTQSLQIWPRLSLEQNPDSDFCEWTLSTFALPNCLHTALIPSVSISYVAAMQPNKAIQDLGTALWHQQAKSLRRWHPIPEVLIWVSAASLLTQITANIPGKAAEDGPHINKNKSWGKTKSFFNKQAYFFWIISYNTRFINWFGIVHLNSAIVFEFLRVHLSNNRSWTLAFSQLAMHRAVLMCRCDFVAKTKGE